MIRLENYLNKNPKIKSMLDPNLKKEVEKYASKSQPVTTSSPHNDHKKIFSISFGLILIIILGSYLIISSIDKEPQLEPEISTYAGDWIDATVEDTVVINVSEATDNRGEYTYGRQSYSDVNGEVYTLFINAYYQGKNIRRIVDEGGTAPINAGSNLDSSNGLPEGFAILKREEGNFVLYLFVDQDWRNIEENIYIVWNNDMSDLGKMQERMFDFSNFENGIYFDKITGVQWLTTNPVLGKVYVGNLRKTDFIENNFEKTFLEIV